MSFRLRSVCVRLLDLNDGSLLHGNTAILVVAELNDDRVVCHIDHNAVKTGGRKNGIAYGNAGQQSFLLLSLF